jgi:hypothetical protein
VGRRFSHRKEDSRWWNFRPRRSERSLGGGLPNEKVDEILCDSGKPVDRPPDRPIIAYDDTLIRDIQAGIRYTCSDVLLKETWYPHEHRLIAEGIRAYTSGNFKVNAGSVACAP